MMSDGSTPRARDIAAMVLDLARRGFRIVARVKAGAVAQPLLLVLLEHNLSDLGAHPRPFANVSPSIGRDHLMGRRR